MQKRGNGLLKMLPPDNILSALLTHMFQLYNVDRDARSHASMTFFIILILIKLRKTLLNFIFAIK